MVHGSAWFPDLSFWALATHGPKAPPQLGRGCSRSFLLHQAVLMLRSKRIRARHPRTTPPSRSSRLPAALPR